MVDYIYAVLHSHKYRQAYHDFLQNGFPTIPYPKDAEYFFALAEYGKKLREAHQLENISRKDFVTKCPEFASGGLVSKRDFIETSEGVGQVWINDTDHFDNVPASTWNLVISGYQTLDKWLKDRNGQKLSGEERQHYQKIVVALCRTIELQDKIDELIKL